MTLLLDGWWATADDSEAHKIDEDGQSLCGATADEEWLEVSNMAHHETCARAYRICGMARGERR